MACDKCGKINPTLRMTETVQGKVRNLRVCVDCAQKGGWRNADGKTPSPGDLEGPHMAEAAAKVLRKMMKDPMKDQRG